MLQIIRAGSMHLPAIHDLANVIWPDTFREILSAEQITYMLNLMYNIEVLMELQKKKDHQFLLAILKDEPVGFAFYHPKENYPSISRLSKIYLLSYHQRKGIGKKIIDYICKELVAGGFSLLELNVNRNNKALGFYEKLGFEIAGEEDIDIGQGYFMNDYILQRRL